MSKQSYITICPESYGLLPIQSFDMALEKFRHNVKMLLQTYGSKRLCDLPQSEILTLLSQTEMLDKSLRSCLTDATIKANSAGELELWSDVAVYNYPGAVLLLTLPPLVNASYKNGEYGISKRAEIELYKWFLTHKPPDFDSDNRFLYAYKRYSSKALGVVSDNDNWEMRRITNAVSQAIGYSDSPRFAEFYYSTVESDYDGAELLLIRHQDLPDFMDFLGSGTPAMPDSPSFFTQKQVQKSSDKISKGSKNEPAISQKSRVVKGNSQSEPTVLQEPAGKSSSEVMPF